MIHLTYQLQVKGSMPDARLIVYIQDYSKDMAIQKRPLILLCPGGGYGRTSDRESEPMALKFLAMGYHVALLRYSCAPARFPTSLVELASAMVLLRDHAEEWHIDAEKIVVQGCSAGGHLAACLGMFWDEDFLAEELGLEGPDHEILKPYGMMLCYPVITSGEFAHRGSFENLLGEAVEKSEKARKEQLLAKLSLEDQVSGKTPKTFIWHTFTDQSVPVENSLLLAGALRKAGVSTELHIYPRGKHGLALANRLTETRDGRALQEECTTWIGLAETWLKNLFEDNLADSQQIETVW